MGEPMRYDSGADAIAEMKKQVHDPIPIADWISFYNDKSIFYFWWKNELAEDFEDVSRFERFLVKYTEEIIKAHPPEKLKLLHDLTKQCDSLRLRRENRKLIIRL